jgi:hypothetical protein
LTDDELKNLIGYSYDMVTKKLPKKLRIQLKIDSPQPAHYRGNAREVILPFRNMTLARIIWNLTASRNTHEDPKLHKVFAI